ncbi:MULTISPECIES: histidine kinase [unclassified Novosphingobium]|uniref:sensor histidine kinase n=1 Tax=unclassified Novosphingobium TaxID=2644732 RepID=UPI000D4848CF|nr:MULTISPECIES: histidine kinase [unclassified Novosphingobium]PTR13101.1 histidine kinase [Novosphingobium sp. GV055]PUB07320.1 histidine kinase [Novosphingobium sp. GV061]PUB23133.1 histidine kinase [Novosphingobium sp. GV079]PUB44897.1 histidine kinase [Novosphingobium sp. GV027]
MTGATSPHHGMGAAGVRSRSGLFLAAIRALIACLFTLWLWIAPPHAVLGGTQPAFLFEGYLVFALVMLAIAWRSWWFEFRLGGVAFFIDALTMLIGLAATEAVTFDFFSAFMTFYAFLTLTSLARWSRRNAMLAAVGLALCFLVAGLAVDWAGVPIDTTKFLRRLSTLGVLSLLLAWFVQGRQRPALPRLDPADSLPGDAGDDAVLPAQVLAYAMGLCQAQGGLLAWAATAEPHPRVHAAGSAARPAAIPPLPPPQATPMLFDRTRGRALCLTASGRLVARSHPEWPALVMAGPEDEGLSIPLSGRTGRGQLVLYGMPGLNADDLFLAQALAREVAAALDDEEARALAREVAMARLRGQIATDLHDSVVQTLAGARFRLEALRLDQGENPATPASHAIAEICESVAGEQDHVRAIIAQLRHGQILPGQRDIHAEIAALARQLARHWHVAISPTPAPAPLPVSTALVYECQHLVREGVANAVRHGQARSITIDLAERDGALCLAIGDDGQGFAGPPPHALPASLATRAAALGGSFALETRAGHTCLLFTLPLDLS